MNRAVIADPDALVRQEIASHLMKAGFESELVSPAKAEECLRACAGKELRLVALQASLGNFLFLAEQARMAAPEGLVIAIADIDGRSALKQAIVDGLVDDFLPLPFSDSDIQGILKLLKGRMR